MEKNESNSEISTILLTEIYQDYKKTKRRQRLYSYFYYGIFLLVIIYMAVAISTAQAALKTASQPQELPEKYIAAVKIEGPIAQGTDSCDFKKINDLLEKAFNDERSVAVLLDLDSPGGVVYDANEIYAKIMFLKKKHPEKKVISYVRGVAASGAYLVACASDEIYASNRFSTLGSIGVYISTINLHNYLKEKKVDPVFIHSGRNKGALNLIQELTPEMYQEIQKGVDFVHQDFIDVVKMSRGERLKADDRTFSGLGFMSIDAMNQGLIDGYDVVLEELIADKVGDYSIEYMHPPKRKIDAFFEGLVERYSALAAKSFYQNLMQQHASNPNQVQAYA